MEKVNQIYYNRPQLHSLLVNANEEYHVLGRGTGKTTGILARKVRDNVLTMPGSSGICVGESYIQILTRTLPALVTGLRMLGLKPDLHFFVRRKPPQKWKWPSPIEPPLDPSHAVFFFNGTVMHLVSQDRKGTSNGINADWVIGDEAKLLDKQQFDDETLPTLRANRALFGKLHNHLSICFTTSMPTVAEDMWILKKEKEMQPERIELILRLHEEIQELKGNGTNASKLYKLERELTELRKGGVLYQEADSFENVAILGEEYFAKMKRIMPAIIWNTEILNLRPDKIKGAFYPDLDLKRHCYEPRYNYEAVERDYGTLQTTDYEDNTTCKYDGHPYRTDEALRISVDWGGHINCMCVGQLKENTLWFLRNFHVLAPSTLDDLANKFCAYYSTHKRKEAHFSYDHTGNSVTANSQYTFAQQFANILKANGWNVQLVTKGAPPTHAEKHVIWSRVLREGNGEGLRVRFNRRACNFLLVSMLNTPLKQGTKWGIEKDKSSERKKKLPQEEATHYSDAADIMLCSLARDVISQSKGIIIKTSFSQPRDSVGDTSRV